MADGPGGAERGGAEWDGTERGGLWRRRRLVNGAWAVGVVVVVAAGWWVWDRSTEPVRCEAYVATVAGAPSIAWDNGITGTGASWVGVLTDGVEHARDDIRPDLAQAVAADDEGYQAYRRALPSASRPVADRQRSRVVDPRPAADRRADAAAMADVVHLHRVAGQECGLV